VRVLVTGSNGHVGGAIALHLRAHGWEVVGLSRRGLDVRGDISSPSFAEQLKNFVSRCDAIVHAAAALTKAHDASEVSMTNCLGTQQVLHLARIWNVASFVYLSSVPVIGRPRHLPVTENHPTSPLTAYHAAKLYGEHLVEIARRSGMQAVTLRLTSPVGPRMCRDRIMAVFVERACLGEDIVLLGQGKRCQNYVDVRDVACAVESCLEQRATGLFHIGGRDYISNLDLAYRCMHRLDSASRIRLSGQPDPEEGIIWDVSIARAAEQLNYKPRQRLEDSIDAIYRDCVIFPGHDVPNVMTSAVTPVF
jgi:nucleoside-diphosphate-sugar epimerase